MKYSEMAAEQRQLVFEHPGAYPLRVRFLGKRALLTMGEVAFLLRSGVDVAVDDDQVQAILGGEQAQEPALAVEEPVRAEIQQVLEHGEAAPTPRRGCLARLGCWSWLLAGFGALLLAVAAFRV